VTDRRAAPELLRCAEDELVIAVIYHRRATAILNATR